MKVLSKLEKMVSLHKTTITKNIAPIGKTSIVILKRL